MPTTIQPLVVIRYLPRHLSRYQLPHSITCCSLSPLVGDKLSISPFPINQPTRQVRVILVHVRHFNHYFVFRSPLLALYSSPQVTIHEAPNTNCEAVPCINSVQPLKTLCNTSCSFLVPSNPTQQALTNDSQPTPSCPVKVHNVHAFPRGALC